MVHSTEMVKRCEACGKEYQARSSKRRYCSVACSSAQPRNRPKQFPRKSPGFHRIEGEWWWYHMGGERRMRAKERTCEQCGKTYPFAIGHPASRFCSRECSFLAQKGRPGPKAEKSTRWKGGRKLNASGYVQIYMPDHPAASSGGRTGLYVLEHRHAMEQHLGRFLKSNEIVHHKNGIKDDNRLENLELIDRSVHARNHRPPFDPPHCPTCTCGE